MAKNSINQFLTPVDVANTLQLNILTIYGYIRSKKITAIKIGRNYRIDRKDFDKFIESNKTK